MQKRAQKASDSRFSIADSLHSIYIGLCTERNFGEYHEVSLKTSFFLLNLFAFNLI